MTLAEFLRARLDEDEALIRRNLGDNGVSDDGHFPDYRTYNDKDLDAADEYIHHFRPPRLLAEVEAKRRIVAAYQTLGQEWREQAATPQDGVALKKTTDRLLGLEMAVRHLSTVHSGHPDYNPAWRP